MTNRKLQRLRERNADFLRERRRQAEDAVRLMSDFVARKREAEELKNGLVIVQAVYGDPKCVAMAASGHPVQSPLVLDVTIPVQYLVGNSQLHIQSGSKSGLLGFDDPCLGDEKHLLVKYIFKGRLHQITVLDNETLVAPLRGRRGYYFIASV